ncbi:hypothetical protein ACLBXM_05450 [Xanthobacteraceae bacterium A53D]
MNAPFTLDTFEDALALHGPDLALWPEAERAAAETLLTQAPDARAALAHARQVEALLHGHLDGHPTAEDEAVARRAMARLAATPLPARPRHWRERLADWFGGFDLRPAWPGMAMLAAMAVLGFALGSQVAEAGWFQSVGTQQVALLDTTPFAFDTDPLSDNGL